MKGLDKLTLALIIIGGINWLLVGLFEFDLVAAIAGTVFGDKNALSTIIYTLVGLSALLQLGFFKRHTDYADSNAHYPHVR